ncbi:MAG: fibronectin type III domain-containing protein [Nitrospirota bacterium]|nr:fibronectin type III domain-containing protein [Nitrospirota bacterium]
MKKNTMMLLSLLTLMLMIVSIVYADIPGRITPAGPAGTGTSGANPGTQQQELPNITFPAPYNVFEFVVTCMACHGGTIDQTAGHGANWGGSNMASAMRDPIFRANEVLVNNTVKNLLGVDGTGNVCMRCHSPNGWLSGRFDPILGGAADGSDTIQSILLSTDTEGISCEMCHRVIGNVKSGRKTTGIDPATGLAITAPIASPAFNMLAGVSDWPHQGNPYPEGPIAGEPLGDSTLQFHDGMGYGGKYSGSFIPYFSDSPLIGDYTGQTWGYNPTTPGVPWINPDGSYTFQFDKLIGPPADDALYAISIEHPTRDGSFIRTPEFCGSCHDLTVPVANHGMPEQRTYTEWKYSDFGRAYAADPTAKTRCQDCHMPTKKHEYADNAKVTLNVDPTLAGWYPYGRDRNPNGGTAFHKLVGANRDLPQMMKILYPEVDLEVIGAPTGHDPTIFPGMLSDRGPMFDRATRNTEIALKEAASIAIIDGPRERGNQGIYDVTVKVTNNAGHRIPSGYPDGRRMWIGLEVKDGAAVVYESGYYDQANAILSNSAADPALTLALTPAIDARVDNAVMVYERGTCMTPLNLDSNAPGVVCDSNGITSNLLNKSIAFDNKIPPAGFDYTAYAANGVKFYTNQNVPCTDGTAGTCLQPVEDPGRFTDNTDTVTYTFIATSGLTLTARAELYWQTHTREFMEHLNQGLNGLAATNQAGPRPEAPPSIFDPNYPLTPTYISDTLGGLGNDLNGDPLQDHWGGIAYAAWLETGKGAPFLVGAADTAVTAVPAPPAAPVVANPIDPATGITDPNVQEISWPAVAGADGYLVSVRYGTDTSTPVVCETDPSCTAAWDKLAVVFEPTTTLTHEALNPGKTFQYKVQAFNAAGFSVDSAITSAKTPDAAVIGPVNTKVAGFTDTTVTLTWFDQDFSELGFVIERQTVTGGILQPFAIVAYVGSQTPGAATGGNTWTDGVTLPPCPADVVNNVPGTAGCYTANWTAVTPTTTYNYQVSAYNALGISPPDLPVTVTTKALLTAPVLAVGAVLYNQVDLAWNSVQGAASYTVLRSIDNFSTSTTLAIFNTPPLPNLYSDTGVSPNTTYYYRVDVSDGITTTQSNVVMVTTPPTPPTAPDSLMATASPVGTIPPYVDVQFTDRSTSETGFALERSVDGGITFTGITSFPAQAGTGSAITYRDANLLPKSTYCYRARAFDGTVFSAYSNTGCAVTPGEIPQAPSNLTVKLGGTKATLKWVDQSNNETYFEIRRVNNGTTTSFTVGAGVTTYVDSTLAKKTTYTYDVRACNLDGCSAFTAPVTITTK